MKKRHKKSVSICIKNSRERLELDNWVVMSSGVSSPFLTIQELYNLFFVAVLGSCFHF